MRLSSEGALLFSAEGNRKVDLAIRKLPVDGFRLRHLGLGFLWAWIYCTWFSPAVFGDASGLTVNNSDTWIVSALFVSASLLISPFLFKRDLIGIPWVVAAAPLANTLGALAMAHQPLFGLSVPALSLAGAALTGISSGWLWIMWGEFFGSIDLRVTYFALPLTVAVPLVCVFLTLGFQGPFAGLAVCFLPLLSGACLFLSLGDAKTANQAAPPPISPSTCLCFFKQGIASFFIYVCISFCWSLVSYEAVGGWSGGIVVAYLVGGAAAAATAYLSTLFSVKRDVFGMYRWLVPATFFAFAALSDASPASGALAFCLITVVQFGFDIVVWIYFSGSVCRGVCPGRFAAGMNRGFVQLGVLAGSILGLHAPGLAQSAGLDVSTIVLLLLGCMTAAVLAFFVSEGLDSQVCATDGAEAPEEPAKEEDWQDRACDALADRCSLTKRERDVLVLLARGRSVPYISEALYVSKNTVESHVKSIYRKTGVHSRQELITCLHETGERSRVSPD